MKEELSTKAMRDVLIDRIYKKMHRHKKIFFLSADFGSPALDRLKRKFKDRFINVGIAEQNLINLATGLALEGFVVYAYAIAPFLTMRAYEQIRVNLSITSQLKEINVNLIGVGAGLSYDVSGPTHHCLEDVTIMRVLPNVMVFSPSDCVLVEKFVDVTLNTKKPKYLRFDGKPLPRIYDRKYHINLLDGFFELKKGKEICIISTGYMTHISLKVAKRLLEDRIKIGVVDMFLLQPFNKQLLYEVLKRYKIVITIEEAFIEKGGLDSIISRLLLESNRLNIVLMRIGFKEKYIFCSGSRDYLHRLVGLDEDSIVDMIKNLSI